MFKKIRFGSSIAALLLFAFPWLDIQCSEKSMATQTGFQMIYGGASASDEMKALGEDTITRHQSKSTDSMGSSPLVGMALILIVAAVGFSYLALFRNSESADRYSSVLPTIALALILIQLSVGFPAKNKIAESMSVGDSKSQTIESLNNPFAGLGASMAAAMTINIRVKTTPALYLELFALALPTLLLANSFIDKHKTTCEQDAPSNGG